MYSGKSLTRAIISVFCILKKRLPSFLQKEKERLPPDSPFSPHIHHFLEVSLLLIFFIFTHFYSLYILLSILSVLPTAHCTMTALCQLPNWYVSFTIQPYLPSSSCFLDYIT
jgi:hypothetical protein